MQSVGGDGPSRHNKGGPGLCCHQLGRWQFERGMCAVTRRPSQVDFGRSPSEVSREANSTHTHACAHMRTYAHAHMHARTHARPHSPTLAPTEGDCDRGSQGLCTLPPGQRGCVPVPEEGRGGWAACLCRSVPAGLHHDAHGSPCLLR